MKKWFEWYLVIAEETSYALAECQVGYAYFEGIGTEKNLEKALYWTTRSAKYGDRWKMKEAELNRLISKDELDAEM